jgi:hypothetical protein
MTTEFAETSEISESISGPFRPGFDPRRNVGRPRKGMTFAELAANLPETTKAQVIDAQVKRAVEDKDTRAAEYLRDTAEGRPQQRVEVHDTSMDTEVFDKVLAALAAAGAIQVIEGEYTELPRET